MNNIVSVKLDSRYASTLGVWQYDYGQVLRITGPELPPAVEVQFSLAEKSGETLSRVGTTVDGVTEVKIPDELLTHSATSNYRIYAYIYLTDETSGNTKYEITIPVRVRSKPTSPAEDPETDPDLFRETVVAVNASAERAENAASSAMESVTEASKYAASASKSAVTAEKTKEDALRKVGEKKQEAIEAIQNQTADSKAGLEQTITNADASKKELEHSIETAGTSKTALDKSVELAGTAKTELDTSIREAGTAKTALDESTETAGTVRETLSATVKQAGALDTSLGEKIKTGTQLKTDLTASGEKAVQDIQTAGSEQLGKMQAVAEAFTADREQIAKNKEDIGSLKEDLSNKITKFYASNHGETHITDSDNGKIQDMMLYGKSERKQYKGINLFPPDTKYSEYVEVSIPKGSLVFWTTDGISAKGGNFRFFNEDKTESMWLGIDSGTTSMRMSLTIDAKYVQNLIDKDFDLSRICLGIGNKPIYEPYTGGIPSPSPDYPQEIKSVVNPTVKVCGKNLWNPILGGYISGIDGSITAAPKTNIAITDFIKTSGKDITVIARNFSSAMKDGFAYRIGFYDARKKWIKNVALSDGNKYSINTFGVTGTEYIRVSAPFGIYDTIQIEKGSEATSYEPYTEQTVQLPYTLNAIPVASGGNVTIDGQQWVCDEIDLKRGVKVQRVYKVDVDGENIKFIQNDKYANVSARGLPIALYDNGQRIYGISTFTSSPWFYNKVNGQFLYLIAPDISDQINESCKKQMGKIYYVLATPIETTLTNDEIAAFNAFITYYPVTNISVNSEQLDGYTVFNYPISMENGWNYVKQQLGDTRDYIYDMDAKAQDIDIQSAEAYVNSEYAVALTELEV